MRPFLTIAILCTALSAAAQQQAQRPVSPLPDAPSEILLASNSSSDTIPSSSSLDTSNPFDSFVSPAGQQSTAAKAAKDSDKSKVKPVEGVPVDADGNPIPLNKRQPQRILGFMPNFRSVSSGAKPHPPGWKYNFKVATRQSFDYSSFIFLGITSLSAEGINSHPVLGKGVGGAWAYTWRGMLDKTDGTYLGAWLLPSLLHQDTRFYPLGNEHRVVTRALYVISRQGVARTYGGRQTPNIAGLGAKVLTQVVSRQYYPTGATSFSTLATKFGYSAMRDIAFSSIREFYPDIAAHYIRKHHEKIAAQAARDAAQSGVVTPPANPL